MQHDPGSRFFLVVAHSARLLAQSAARGGHAVCALDLFHDADTERLAQVSEAVQARAGDEPGFDRDDLLLRAARLCPPSRCLGLVVGAGFEDDPVSLQLLACGRELFGNDAEFVARLKDPAEFFPLLDRLGISHPETSLTLPRQPAGWLVKRRGASGGTHIAEAGSLGDEAVAPDLYFQRLSPGRSLSVLFLADGRRAMLLGCSRQLVQGGACRYRYAGAVGPVELPAAVHRRLGEAVAALVAHTGLVGCNSMDFLLHGDRLNVLEINPRPSATFDLYDADWPRGLFDAHLRACRGELPARPAHGEGRTVRAHRIVAAADNLLIGDECTFPAWCSDIPRVGSRIAVGAPVCTVHAEGENVPGVLQTLRRRRQQVERRIEKQMPIESPAPGQTDPEETLNGAEYHAPERQSWRCAPGQSAAGTARRPAPGCAPS